MSHLWISCLFTKSLMSKEPNEPGSDDQPVAGTKRCVGHGDLFGGGGVALQMCMSQ